MFLNQSYIRLLQEITPTLTTACARRSAKVLIDLLPDAFALKDLLTLFTACIPPSNPPLFMKDAGFYAMIKDWKNQIAAFKVQLTPCLLFAYQGLSRTDNLRLSPHVICLMQFIKTELLDNACVHSHAAFDPFIRLLIDPDLTPILDYLSQLTESDNPTLQLPASTILTSDRYTAVAKLLNSQKMAKNDGKISEKAGILLEIALKIYHDFNEILTIKLSEVRAEFPVSQEERYAQNTCVLI